MHGGVLYKKGIKIVYNNRCHRFTCKIFISRKNVSKRMIITAPRRYAYKDVFTVNSK
jgi:hypothetical protein